MRLISVADMSLWATGSSTTIDAADELAAWIIEQASGLVAEEVGREVEWAEEGVTIPTKAKVVVANVCRRCWNNADQETRNGIAGGPNQALHETAALGLALSDADLLELAKVKERLALDADPGKDDLWTLGTTRGPIETVLYVPDDRWPASTPIAYLDPVADSYYKPTDAPLPTNVDGDTDFAAAITED